MTMPKQSKQNTGTDSTVDEEQTRTVDEVAVIPPLQLRK